MDTTKPWHTTANNTINQILSNGAFIGRVATFVSEMDPVDPLQQRFIILVSSLTAQKKMLNNGSFQPWLLCFYYIKKVIILGPDKLFSILYHK